MSFTFLTEPYLHQREAFERSKDAKSFALLMEQRTGKTKVTIDTAAYLYHQHLIDALLIVAPNGVHRNWITDELPIHLHPNTHPNLILFSAQKAATKAWETSYLTAIKHPGLLVIAINVEALTTNAALDALALLFSTRKVMAAIDESQVIKTPGIKRTKVAMRIARRALYRRILTGTPVTQGPLDLFSQFGFLDHEILGHRSYYTFKYHFAEWEDGYNGKTNKTYKVLKRYKNLDELQTRLAPHSFRITRAECFDLPPKIYQKRYFALTPKQREAYDRLRDEFIMELDAATRVSVALVLTRYLRLQQVASNYWPGSAETSCPVCDGADLDCSKCKGQGIVSVPTTPTIIDPDTNPRIDAMNAVIDETPDKQFIVWARFHNDIDDIMRALKHRKISAVRYDGTIPAQERGPNLINFQAGHAQAFVSNPQAGGRGLKISAADYAIYYSNNFSLEQRLQSEDRPIDAHKHTPLSVLDLVAEETIDEHIVTALRNKQALADIITGDRPRDWL